MTNEDAFQLIKAALETVCPGVSSEICIATDLAEIERLDSLHLMEMLFELENQLGKKIDNISDEYSDFRVEALIQILIQV